jgi:arylsulfatase A-like enzyme
VWDGYDAFAQSRAAVEYLAERRRTGEPFLLMLSWGPPHFPLDTAPDPYRARYAGRTLALRDNVPADCRERAQEELRGYYAHIAALDDALKIVLDGLRDLGLADDTIVVFTSDHGDMRQSQGLETKLFPWDESIRVPFLLRHPGLPHAAGTRVPVLIDAPDIMPTLLRLCDLPVPGSVEGRDWSAEMTGRRPVDPDSDALLGVAAETTELRFNGMHAWRGLRTLRYTYVRNTEGPWLLYDNDADPYQKRNRIGDPEHRTLVEKLDRRLSDRLTERGDEFLSSAATLTRAGLAHYREAHSPLQRVWRDPWAAGGGLAMVTEGRETVR